MQKSFLPSDLRSRWGVRRGAGDSAGLYLIEHEVTIRGGASGIEVVARFVHALPDGRRHSQGFGRNWRGGLVGLTLRRTRNAIKRIGVNSGPPKCTFTLRAVAIAPQSRTATSGTSSPVAGPLPISVTSSVVLPVVLNSETAKEAISPPSSVSSPVTVVPEQSCAILNAITVPTSLSPDANTAQTSSWLRAGRFHSFESTFSSFSAADILRLSRDDLIQICGLVDGIRLFNALHSKAPAPRLTLYFSAEGSGSLWRAVYLDSLTSNALGAKLYAALGALGPPQDQLHSVVLLGPHGIHVLVTDELVANMKDESMYIIEVIKDSKSDRYKLILKPSTR